MKFETHKGTTKVRMVRGVRFNGRDLEPGQVVDLPDAFAHSLISEHRASLATEADVAAAAAGAKDAEKGEKKDKGAAKGDPTKAQHGDPKPNATR